MHSNIEVFSEIGQLKQVMLHRPGLEMENFTPNYLKEFLFDDILYLKVAQQEHDAFSKVLQDEGVEVCYVEQYIAQALAASEDKGWGFVNQYLLESGIVNPRIRALVQAWLYDSYDSQGIVDKLIAGVRSHELPNLADQSLSGMISRSYPFITKPVPNLLFMRDPFISVGNGLIISSMKNSIRQRETLMMEYLFTHHLEFAKKPLPIWFNRDNISSLEGGDVLVINKKTLFVGISERTDAYSVELLADNLFKAEHNTIKKIVAFVIPKKRAFMHLDTVFTQIDYNKFTIHAGIEGTLTLYTVTPARQGDSLHIMEEQKSLQQVLNETTGQEVKLLRCGGGDAIAGDREQWNDGANTLAIAPGVVCVYERNHVTNQLLVDNGLRVLAIASSELSRGRGGPRCMSMPLKRKIL